MLNHYYCLDAQRAYNNCKFHIAEGSHDGKAVYSYMYLEIMPKIFLDRYGVFRDLNERRSCLEAPVLTIKTFNNVEDAKKELHALGITYGDSSEKAKARKVVAQMVPAIKMKYWGSVVTVGILATETYANTPAKVEVAFLNTATKQFGESCFLNGAEVLLGFISEQGLMRC